MGIISTIFSNWTNYRSWNKFRTAREFLILLTNVSTGEVYTVLDNPAGIDKFGYSLVRHDKYHGMLEDYNVSLGFAKKEGGGGKFINDLYLIDGIESNMLCDVYFKNANSEDFDLLYNYKIHYVAGSYSEDDYFINCNLVNIGFSQKFLSRTGIEIDITKTESLDGNTITDEALEDVYLPTIDVYLYADTDTGYLSLISNFTGAGSTNINYFGGISELNNEAPERFTFKNITDGILYRNNTEFETYVKLKAQDIWTVTTNCGTSTYIRLYLRFETYNSAGALDQSVQLMYHENYYQAVKTELGTINTETAYLRVQAGGWAKYYAYVDYNQGYPTDVCSINYFTDLFNQYYRVFEKSVGAGETAAQSYSLQNAFKKSIRLLTGVNDSYLSNYIPTSEANNIYITSGWNVRKFPNKGVSFKFDDLFSSAGNAEGLGLGYDFVNNRIIVENLEYFYQDVQVVDFGTVKNFKKEPSNHYYSEILGGSNSDGIYEKRSGVYAFNVQHIFSTNFDSDNKINLRIPFRIDSLCVEYLRRELYSATGSTDTKNDSEIIMVGTYDYLSNKRAKPNYNNIYGFEGSGQYINGRYLAPENIRRNGGILRGMFKYSKGLGSVNFRSNKKNINVEYDPSRNLTDNIPEALLGKAFFYPEAQEFEASVTLDQIKAIRANPHGYYRCQDEIGGEHFGYFTQADVRNLEFKINVKGLTANIDR